MMPFKIVRPASVLAAALTLTALGAAVQAETINSNLQIDPGQTFELGGPQVLTMGELQRWIADATGRSPLFVDVPDAVAGALASGLGWAPGAPITKDQWLMLQKDNVVANGAAGLTELGVSPTSLAAVADDWLVQYRRHGRFAVQKPARPHHPGHPRPPGAWPSRTACTRAGCISESALATMTSAATSNACIQPPWTATLAVARRSTCTVLTVWSAFN